MTQHLISTEGWQPIETAPRDCEVDLWMVDWVSGLEWREPDCWFDADTGRWMTVDLDRGNETVGFPGIQEPTHWRHLPTPPAGEQA